MDEIEDAGPGPPPPAASTSHAASRPNGATASASSSRAPTNPQPGLDRAPGNAPPKTGVVQPKPQALPKRTGPSSIIVSPRQKGNPVLTNVKTVPWEYGDIPADYVLGLTTCALFLSLKYHRIHPEYIYKRIRDLQGRYNLRVVLVMVDIGNHEEALRELSKTSLINNVTLILAWSSVEAGRYLELLKAYEHAAPTAIKQHQSTAYADRMTDFVTTPRAINKTDAVSLVSQFGSVRTAVNARHEDVAGIAGWGEKKVARWCAAVREPFRVKRAAKRGIAREDSTLTIQSQSISRAISREVTRDEGSASPNPGPSNDPPLRSATPGRSGAPTDADQRPRSRLAEAVSIDAEDDGQSLAEAMTAAPLPPKQAVEAAVPAKRKPADDALSDGVMAALSKLRKTGD